MFCPSYTELMPLTSGLGVLQDELFISPSLIFHHGQQNKIAVFSEKLGHFCFFLPLTLLHKKRKVTYRRDEVENRPILLFQSWLVLRQDLLISLESPIGNKQHSIHCCALPYSWKSVFALPRLGGQPMVQMQRLPNVLISV